MLQLQLKSEHDDAIRGHAQRAYPHECCGFLLGRDDDQARRIVRVVEAQNDRGDSQLHNRFTITPEAFMRVDKAARAEKLDVLGFYHSHPNAPARPSTYDLEYAWPVYSYIIVAVADGKSAKMTCWLLRDDRGRFDEQPITCARETGSTKEIH